MRNSAANDRPVMRDAEEDRGWIDSVAFRRYTEAVYEIIKEYPGLYATHIEKRLALMTVEAISALLAEGKIDHSFTIPHRFKAKTGRNTAAVKGIESGI